VNYTIEVFDYRKGDGFASEYPGREVVYSGAGLETAFAVLRDAVCNLESTEEVVFSANTR